MKSIEKRFIKLQGQYPMLSSYTNFASAVKEGRFSTDSIHRWFNRLVDKEDYCRADKKAILAHLEALSNPLRTTEIRAKLPLGQHQLILQ